LVSKNETKSNQVSEIISQLENFRSQKRVIVQCHGVFDLLHPGHILHLEEAKSLGDVLVVTVTPDRFVNKGPGRPVYSQDQRVLMLRALEVVDLVAITDSPIASDAILAIKPNIYVKGPDYSIGNQDITGNISIEESTVASVGGKIYFTSAPSMSSSKLINAHVTKEKSETSKWLGNLRSKYSEKEILDWIKRVSELNVLVIGEAIIDEYLICEALGKSSKDPVLAFRELTLEQQIGGSLAIANHCAGLGANVYSLFRIGIDQDDEKLIIANLNSNIKATLLKSQFEPTIKKRRFIDELTEARVFETYVMNDGKSTSDDESKLVAELERILPEVDLVIVADYGHGLMTEKVITKLSDGNVLLAVNTQSNAGNRGFNTISKYSKLDYVSLNGSELGLELRRKHTSMDELVAKLRIQSDARRVMVTEGAKGLSICDEDDVVEHAPAFAQQIRDRVGAGDALFAVTSMLSAVGAPKDVTGFYGNLAGAAVISELGNRKSVSIVDLTRHATALLK
jgi:rfaE bifunctional protein kinase chain/domain/rfaE bifunctional protein nucleotidyltransferase chain/domain